MTRCVSSDADTLKQEFDAIPLQRWGGESDVAGIAVLLASQAGAYVTGEVPPVDGGFNAFSGV